MVMDGGMLLKMGCGCSEKAAEIQRYHEMMGSCDVGNGDSGMATNRYGGLARKVSGYGNQGGLY